MKVDDILLGFILVALIISIVIVYCGPLIIALIFYVTHAHEFTLVDWIAVAISEVIWIIGIRKWVFKHDTA